MLKKIIFIFFVFYNLFYLIDFSINKEEAKLIFFDVGQGDSALLISPSGKSLIIDGGPNSLLNQKISKYLASDKKNIDWMILSHDHRDHYYGLMLLGDYYQIDNYLGPLSSDIKNLNEWLIDLKEKGTTFHSIKKNIIQYNLEDNCYFQVLAPPLSFLKENVSKNNSSIAVKINCLQIEALFVGDAEKESELMFLKYAPHDFLESSIFKVNHHGSKSSNQSEFLKAVAPKYAIICVGANNHFGHPHKEVLNNLRKLNIIVFQTDRDGDIEFLANKRELLIK